MTNREEFVNRAKIVATLGPACAASPVMREMVEAGVDVARVNFSHGSAAVNLELIRTLREAARAADKPVAVMQDLQGAKLRLGFLASGDLTVLPGSLATFFTGADKAEGDVVPVPEGRLAQQVQRGDRLLVHDGQIEFEVLNVTGRRIRTRTLLGGVVRSGQGLTVPTARVAQATLTEKDRNDLALGVEGGVDFVALSHVRAAADVQELRQAIAKLAPADAPWPAIVVKIENHAALQNFAAILEEADAVMIARGDLGLETPVAAVPVRQKELTLQSVVAGKPVMVATQLLGSMVAQPRPSRAEVSDVANAVLDLADALLLSDETAIGRYPVRSVQQLAEIIERTEAAPVRGLMPEFDSRGESVPRAVAAAAVQLARNVDAVAIVVTTQSGYSARAVVRYRPDVPVFAATASPSVQRQLTLSWGVTPLLVDGASGPEDLTRGALGQLKRRFGVAGGSRLVLVSGLRRPAGGFDSAVRVVEV